MFRFLPDVHNTDWKKKFDFNRPFATMGHMTYPPQSNAFYLKKKKKFH